MAEKSIEMALRLSTTRFESLFPLLTLHDSYLSPCEVSLNGPRYAATDRTTAEAFEIRCVPITRIGVAYSHQQLQSMMELCKKRADQLLAAKASVGHHHSTFVFPDDVYHSIEKHPQESRGSSRALQQHITCVSVTARGGYSLQDVMNAAAALRREESHSEAPQDFDAFLLDRAPPFLAEKAFVSILKAVENYCSVHLTLPPHGNLTCHAVVLKSTATADCWAIGDWLLDPQQLPSLSSNIHEQSSKLSEMLTVQRKFVTLLRRAFLGGKRRGNVSGAPRAAVVHVRRPNGTCVPLEDIEGAISKAANTWHHQTLEIMRATLTSQAADAQGRDNDDSCWSDSSSSGGSTTSAQARAHHHMRLLAQERIQAAIDGRSLMAARTDDAEQFGEDTALRSPTGVGVAMGNSPLSKHASPDVILLDLPPLKRRVLGPGSRLDIEVGDSNSAPQHCAPEVRLTAPRSAPPSHCSRGHQRPPPPGRARGGTPLLDVFPKVTSPPMRAEPASTNKTYFSDGIVSTVIEEVVLVQGEEPQRQLGATSAIEAQRTLEAACSSGKGEGNPNGKSHVGTRRISSPRIAKQSSCCSFM